MVSISENLTLSYLFLVLSEKKKKLVQQKKIYEYFFIPLNIGIELKNVISKTIFKLKINQELYSTKVDIIPG